jgi:hypothetical protein
MKHFMNPIVIINVINNRTADKTAGTTEEAPWHQKWVGALELPVALLTKV